MTAEALSGCFAVVLRALPETTWPPETQLLWLAERELEDQFDLLPDTTPLKNGDGYTPLHWHEVTAALAGQLQCSPLSPHPSFSQRYQRKRLLLWLRDASIRAGEADNVIPLLEREVETCRCYEVLVQTLRDAGERDCARDWCLRGFKKTLNEAPGIAYALLE